MFLTAIRNNKFLKNEANFLFKNIIEQKNDDYIDSSLITTLRALMYGRIENKTISAVTYKTSEETFRIKKLIKENNLREILESMNSPIYFEYISDEERILKNYFIVTVLPEKIKKDVIHNLFNFLDSSTVIYNNLERIEILEKHALNNLKTEARFYINKKNEIVWIIIEDNIEGYHGMQAYIPKLMPWIFTDKPSDILTEKEKELLKSLTEKESKHYIKIVDDIAKNINFREIAIDLYLNNACKSAIDDKIREKERLVERAMEKMENLTIRYNEELRTIEALNIEILGLTNKDKIEINELKEYLKHNKAIIPYKENNGTIDIVVDTTIDMWDPDAYETIMQNENSYLRLFINSSSLDESSTDEKNILLNNLFKNERFEISVVSNYSLNIFTGEVDCYKHFNYNDIINLMTRIPNPHIEYYACLGQWRNEISQEIRTGNLVMAFEKCVASAKSINLLEGTVMRKFFNNIFNYRYNDKILIDKTTNDRISPKEAIKKLKKEKENNG